MATDIEESDRISPKKQRTLLSQTNDYNESNSCAIKDEQNSGPSNLQKDYEEEKKRKMREWQAWQVRKASEDNSINEMFIPVNPVDYPWYEILTELNMENQAVSMAIQNHGLVCSTNISQPQTFRDNFLFDCRTAERHINFFRNSTEVENNQTFSKTKLPLNEDYNSVKDKIYDNDQQQDFFLEQAVAEAIKKKGLSALSVDYG